ncbi:MAG: hypothetical protein PHS42_05310 [Sulfurimonas sp.]|nr:hypothetical protein [Sulfurimonas sp.]MDD3834877.1 hypothetical protein [Sulfurimonas sp.]
MNVTSTTQTQYTTTGTSNTRTQGTSPYDEVAKKKQPTRYETLLAMNYDNMNEVERKELSYWNGMRSVSYLDEEGNKALNEALQGKTDAEKSQIKSVLELSFMTNVKANHETKTIDRQKFDSIDTSKEATVSRFENFIAEFEKNGDVDNIGLIDVMDKFLGIYDKTPSDIKNQEDSVVDDFFEDLYSKESLNFTSSVTKQDIQDQVKEYAAFLEQELGSSDEAKSIIANLMTEFKTALMDELKKSIDSTTNTAQEKQSAIKVLVDEEKSEKESSLEILIGRDTKVDKSTNVTNVDDGHGIPTVEELLDEEGMAQLNKTLAGMPEQDQIMIKLVLSFQLSIKSENDVDGKLQIEWETGQLDTQDILKKLDLMIDKRKDRIMINPLFTEKLDYIVDELKTFYTNKSEISTNSINKEDSLVDEKNFQ